MEITGTVIKIDDKGYYGKQFVGLEFANRMATIRKKDGVHYLRFYYRFDGKVCNGKDKPLSNSSNEIYIEIKGKMTKLMQENRKILLRKNDNRPFRNGKFITDSWLKLVIEQIENGVTVKEIISKEGFPGNVAQLASNLLLIDFDLYNNPKYLENLDNHNNEIKKKFNQKEQMTRRQKFNQSIQRLIDEIKKGKTLDRLLSENPIFSPFGKDEVPREKILRIMQNEFKFDYVQTDSYIEEMVGVPRQLEKIKTKLLLKNTKVCWEIVELTKNGWSWFRIARKFDLDPSGRTHRKYILANIGVNLETIDKK